MPCCKSNRCSKACKFDHRNLRCTGRTRCIYSRWNKNPKSCKPTYRKDCCGDNCRNRSTRQHGNFAGGFYLSESPGPLFGSQQPVCIGSG